MSSNAQKRKNKKKYFQSSKKFKHSALEPGMRGFLITCNDEHRCIKEAYNLLNEFADKMYGLEFKQIESADSDIDVTSQLAREISAIKSERRFQQVFMKAKGVVFINSSVCNPVALVDKIFETVIDSGKKRTRFILKLKPVVITCKAHGTDIRRVLDDILASYSSKAKDKEITYKVESKVRFNDTITSSHLIWYTRDSVNKVAPKWIACILEPQVMISFYVLRSVCCISILDKYEKYKKYNLSIAASLKNENCNSQVSVEETLTPKSVDEHGSMHNLSIAASSNFENSKSQESVEEIVIPTSANGNGSTNNLSIAASPQVENCKSQEIVEEISIPKSANESGSTNNLSIAASLKVENCKSQEIVEEIFITKSDNKNGSINNLSIAASAKVENCKNQESMEVTLILKSTNENGSTKEVTSDQPVPTEQ